MLQVGSSNYEIQTFTVGRKWKYVNNDFCWRIKRLTFDTLLHWVSKVFFKAYIQFGLTDVG